MQNNVNTWDDLENKIYNTAKQIKQLEMKENTENKQVSKEQNKLKLVLKDFHKIIKYCFNHDKVDAIYKVKEKAQQEDVQLAEIIDDFIENEIDSFEFSVNKTKMISKMMLMPIVMHSEKNLNPMLSLNDLEEVMREFFLTREVIASPDQFKLSSFRAERNVLVSLGATDWWNLHHSEFEPIDDIENFEVRDKVSTLNVDKSLTLYFAPIFIQKVNEKSIDMDKVDDFNLWDDLSDILTQYHIDTFNQYDADVEYEILKPSSIYDIVKSSYFVEQNIAFENFIYLYLNQDVYEFGYTQMVDKNGDLTESYIVTAIDAEDHTLTAYFKYELGDLNPMEFLEDMTQYIHLSNRKILWNLDEKFSEETIKEWSTQAGNVDFSKIIKKSEMIDIQATHDFINLNIHNTKPTMH